MKKIIGLSLALLAGACAAPTYTGPEIDKAAMDAEAVVQKTYAFRRILVDQQRLQNVGYRIAKHGAEMCGQQVSPKYGFLANDIAAFKGDYKSIARKELNSDVGLTVFAVAEGSPAAQAGLMVGDAFRKINGKPIKSDTDLSAILLSAGQDPIDLQTTVERNGVEETLVIWAEMACNFNTAFEDSSRINAFADGKNVVVTKGMMRFVENDDELALVVGHEFAHNAMRHLDAKSTNQMGGMAAGLMLDVLAAVAGVNTQGTFMKAGAQIGAGAYSQDFEREADTVGLYLTARAGYDLENSREFWRRMGADHPKAIETAGSHPPSTERSLVIQNQIAEIKLAQTENLPLMPANFEPKGPIGGETPKTATAAFPE